MRTIHKFGPLEIGAITEVPIQEAAELLCVALQSGWIFVWALVDTDKLMRTQGFSVVGTGWAFDESMIGARYVGAVHADGFVWHVHTVPR